MTKYNSAFSVPSLGFLASRLLRGATLWGVVVLVTKIVHWTAISRKQWTLCAVGSKRKPSFQENKLCVVSSIAAGHWGIVVPHSGNRNHLHYVKADCLAQTFGAVNHLAIISRGLHAYRVFWVDYWCPVLTDSESLAMAINAHHISAGGGGIHTLVDIFNWFCVGDRH